MTKEHYLQLKKQVRVWFTVNIIIGLIAIAGGILVIISKSRHIPYLLMCLGGLTLMNQALIYPVFNGKKEAEEAHPEWKELSTKDSKIPVERVFGIRYSSSDCHYWFFHGLSSSTDNRCRN